MNSLSERDLITSSIFNRKRIQTLEAIILKVHVHSPIELPGLLTSLRFFMATLRLLLLESCEFWLMEVETIKSVI